MEFASTSEDDFSDYDCFWDSDSKDSGSGPENEKLHYEVLTINKILELLNKEVEEVSKVIQISKTTTRVLLTRLKWNKFDLMERFFTDEYKMFWDTKVIKNEVIQGDATNLEYCPICFDVFSVSDLIGVECRHKYCRSCWKKYLTIKILEVGIDEAISCAAYNCSVLVEDEMVMTLLTNFEAMEIYERMIVSSFVECSAALRWCPNANCRKAIKVDLEQIDCKPVSCYCATRRFCFYCSQNWHAPLKCTLLKEWGKLIVPECLESIIWIQSNTKMCPKCSAHIQKVGGSDLMCCSNLKCKFMFCSNCMKPLDSDHTLPCTNKKEKKPADDKQACSLNNPEFTLLIYINFMTNKELLESDKILCEKSVERTRDLAKQGIPYMVRNILEEASDVLVQSRQMAMYAYVFEFFHSENDHFFAFKENQANLLDATETLSSILKDSLESDFLDHNLLLQDTVAYCSASRKALEDHIYEGYTKNWFKLKYEES